MVPGASFVMTLRSSLFGSRLCGLMTALGLSLGMALHAAYLLPSLYWFQHNSSFLLQVITWFGAGYLLFIAVQCLQAKPKGKLAIEKNQENITPIRALFMGFLTDALNPKIIIFILALLSQYIQGELTFSQQLSYGAILVSVQLIWFSAVALFFSLPALRERLYSSSHWIERCSGILLILLAIKILWSH
ncbi:LysE family transporter [uncultured Shewanella sp.]|uniref:LysE family translocator n=1 Tax=uncultured Shewanella sp. TaxID=173975 RepID=UPI00260E4015|nr:LysE family transporter [uncultured Shewanella sp.]